MLVIADEIKKLLTKGKKYLLKYFSDYSFTMSGILLLTIYEAVVLIMCYEYDIAFPFDEDFLSRGLFLFIPAAFWIENCFVHRKFIKAAAFLAAGVIAASLAFFTGLDWEVQIGTLSASVISSYTSRFMAGYLLLLLLLSVYTCFKRAAVSFEEYLVKVFHNFMWAVLVYCVVAVGVAFIGAAFDTLFFDGFSEWRNVPQIFVFGFYFAPKCIFALTDIKNEPGALMQIIVKYVLAILTICAMAVVYLYMFKILLQREIPSNEIFSIVSMLFVLGMPVWMMAGYYFDGSRYFRILSVMPYIFAPLICLQIYSMCARIGQYGMTPQRYAGTMLIVFEAGTLIMWRFEKKRCERLLPFLCILVVISVFVPGINGYQVSNLWQSHFLATYYKAACGGTQLTKLEYERLKGAYQYLCSQPEMKKVTEEYDIYEDTFSEKLNVLNEAENDLTQIQKYRIHCCQMVGELDVDGCLKMFMLNQDESYGKRSKGFFPVLYPDKDGNQAVVLDGSGINVDFSCFRFVKRETGEIVTVDLFPFLWRCMSYLKEHPDAGQEEMSREMKTYNRIAIDEDTMLYLNHFEIWYEEGISYGKPYFEWTKVNLGGVLLVK